MNSKIILAKGIHLDREYVNVLNYTETEMLNLLTSNTHLVASANDYQFIRTNQVINTQFTYEQCIQSNYIAFQNPDYSNKWFFAWIDDVIYKGNNNTQLTFTIDSWTTWFSDWSAHKCFVKRMHTNDDTIGLNRVPENLPVNNVIEIDDSTDSSLIDYYIALETDWIFKDNSVGHTGGIDPGTLQPTGDQFAGITAYNGIISGHQYILFDTGNELYTWSDAVNYLKRTIARTNIEGHIADIHNLFVVPHALVSAGDLDLHTAYTTQVDEAHKIEFYTLDPSVVGEHYTYEVTKNTSYTGYTPKNNKVFQYPWNYLYITNNNGSYNIYKYEDFYNQTKCEFDISLALTIGISCKLAPINYKNQGIDLDNGLSLGKYPTFSWSSDAFTNWLTSQSVNIATNWIGGTANEYSKSEAKDDFTPLSPEMTGLSIASKIGQTIGTFYSGNLKPNINGGTNTADVNWSRTRNTFYFRRMRASLEDIKIADDYFTRFGYAYNRLETPNITGRTYWNYLEIGANEDIGYGNVPTKHMEIINNACRKGVTIWHNHTNIGNYNLTNTIVTPPTP